jgi:hypothetical protein
MSAGKIKYGSWIFRVLGWDGLLPACVILILTVIDFLFPNNRGAVEITGVATPAMMFILRLIAGKHHIATNHCSVTFRRIQLCIFYFGILVLGFIDGVLILSHLTPKGALFVDRQDLVVWVALFSIYLMSMVVAMYPGRDTSPDDRPWPDDAIDAQAV